MRNLGSFPCIFLPPPPLEVRVEFLGQHLLAHVLVVRGHAVLAHRHVLSVGVPVGEELAGMHGPAPGEGCLVR